MNRVLVLLGAFLVAALIILSNMRVDYVFETPAGSLKISGLRILVGNEEEYVASGLAGRILGWMKSGGGLGGLTLSTSPPSLGYYVNYVQHDLFYASGRWWYVFCGANDLYTAPSLDGSWTSLGDLVTDEGYDDLVDAELDADGSTLWLVGASGASLYLSKLVLNGDGTASALINNRLVVTESANIATLDSGTLYSSTFTSGVIASGAQWNALKMKVPVRITSVYVGLDYADGSGGNVYLTIKNASGTPSGDTLYYSSKSLTRSATSVTCSLDLRLPPGTYYFRVYDSRTGAGEMMSNEARGTKLSGILVSMGAVSLAGSSWSKYPYFYIKISGNIMGFVSLGVSANKLWILYYVQGKGYYLRIIKKAQASSSSGTSVLISQIMSTAPRGHVVPIDDSKAWILWTSSGTAYARLVGALGNTIAGDVNLGEYGPSLSADIDDAGNVWVALGQGPTVYKLKPDGTYENLGDALPSVDPSYSGMVLEGSTPMVVAPGNGITRISAYNGTSWNEYSYSTTGLSKVYWIDAAARGGYLVFVAADPSKATNLAYGPLGDPVSKFQISLDSYQVSGRYVKASESSPLDTVNVTISIYHNVDDNTTWVLADSQQVASEASLPYSGSYTGPLLDLLLLSGSFSQGEHTYYWKVEVTVEGVNALNGQPVEKTAYLIISDTLKWTQGALEHRELSISSTNMEEKVSVPHEILLLSLVVLGAGVYAYKRLEQED